MTKNIAQSVLVNHMDDEILQYFRDNNQYFIGLTDTYIEKMEQEPIGYEDYKTYVSSMDTINIVYNYLMTVNPQYAENFSELISNGNINLYDKNDRENEKAQSGMKANFGYIELDDKIIPDIDVPMSYNIDDAYALLHEFIHSTNFELEPSKKDFSSITYMLVESTPIMHEFQFYEYLVENNICPEDNFKPILNRLDNTYGCACTLNDAAYEVKKINEKGIDIDLEVDDFEKTDLYLTDGVKAIEYFLGTVIGLSVYNLKSFDVIGNKNINTYNDLLSNADDEGVLTFIGGLPNAEELVSSIDFLLEIMKRDCQKSV